MDKEKMKEQKWQTIPSEKPTLASHHQLQAFFRLTTIRITPQRQLELLTDKASETTTLF